MGLHRDKSIRNSEARISFDQSEVIVTSCWYCERQCVKFMGPSPPRKFELQIFIDTFLNGFTFAPFLRFIVSFKVLKDWRFINFNVKTYRR